MSGNGSSRSFAGPWLAIVLVLFLAQFLVGSNCDDLEILAPVTVEASSETTSDTVVIEFPYVGRSSLDFSVENTGESSASVELRAQSRQLEDPNRERCETLDRTPDGSTTLEAREEPPIPGPGSLPRFEVDGDVIEVELEPDESGFEGWARLDGIEGRVQILTAPESFAVQIYDENSNELAPLSAGESTCDADVGVARWSRFLLEEETFSIRIRGSTPTVLFQIDETCESRETVDRTCPGAAGEVVTRELALDAGEITYGRFFSTELGVGNGIAATLACSEGTSCNVTASLTPYIEALECESDGDCSARRSCSSGGYCLAEPSGCSVEPARQLSWSTAALMILGFIGLLFRCRDAG